MIVSSARDYYSFKNMHWINNTPGLGRLAGLTIALWGHTLDQHHTGWKQVEVGTHIGLTPHWVEAGW